MERLVLPRALGVAMLVSGDEVLNKLEPADPTANRWCRKRNEGSQELLGLR